MQEKGGSNRMDAWQQGISVEGAGFMEGDVNIKIMEDGGGGIGSFWVNRGWLKP